MPSSFFDAHRLDCYQMRRVERGGEGLGGRVIGRIGELASSYCCLLLQQTIFKLISDVCRLPGGRRGFCRVVGRVKVGACRGGKRASDKFRPSGAAHLIALQPVNYKLLSSLLLNFHCLLQKGLERDRGLMQ